MVTLFQHVFKENVDFLFQFLNLINSKRPAVTGWRCRAALCLQRGCALGVCGGIFSGRLRSDIYCSVLHASFIVLIILCVILMQHLKGTVLIMLYISGGICYHKRRCWNNF